MYNCIKAFVSFNITSSSYIFLNLGLISSNQRENKLFFFDNKIFKLVFLIVKSF